MLPPVEIVASDHTVDEPPTSSKYNSFATDDRLVDDYPTRLRAKQHGLDKPSSDRGVRIKFGGPPETRTPDPLIKSQLLYQLS